MNKLKISFIFNDHSGLLEVKYEENHSVFKSSFDIVSNLNSDVNMCIGYSALNAYITYFSKLK